MTLLEQLIRDEGLKLFPYKDEVGKITIGVGRNLTDVGISRAEATTLLIGDIQNAKDHLAQQFPWTVGLDDARRDALVAMTFNMGIGGLASFKTFLAAMQAGNWTVARDAMLDSEWAKQVGARAQRLAVQVDSGTYQ
jgi:lysozyme